MSEITHRTGSPERRRDGGPHPTDIHVGARLRLRRDMLGLSRKQLSEAAGLSSRQMRQYELGAERIGARRLAQFAQILAVPVTFFFDGVDAGQVAARASRSAATEDGTVAREP